MRWSNVALIALLVVVAALSIGSVRMDSATSDEPAHVAAGVIKLTDGWLSFFREQPPLMNSLSALPVVMTGYRMPNGWQGVDHWTVGRYFFYRAGYDAHRMLFLARLPTILLFLVLCFGVYNFVLWQTRDRWWAVGAAALAGFCPNLMAHGRLATVDFGLTFFAFVSTMCLLALIERPSMRFAILFGISAVAAPMAKVSGLILGPYFLAVIVAAFALNRIADRRAFLRAFAVSIVSGLVFFEVFTLGEMSREFLSTMYRHTPALLAPFADYIENVRAIRDWYAHGHELPQFFAGQFSQRGWREYYVAAFLLKTTLPAILLLVIALVAAVRKRSFALWSLLGFVVLFLAVASAGHLDLGLRYVLPIYPFLYAAIAVALHGQHSKRFLIALLVLVVWHAGENIFNYPNYISYFNEVIGSKRNADKFLVDSNLDWGQDLRRLDAWCRAHAVTQLTVQYFGGGDIGVDLPSVQPRVLMAPEPTPLPRGYFALSRHLYRIAPALWGVDYDDYLRANHAVYVTTIGGSINVYRVE